MKSLSKIEQIKNLAVCSPVIAFNYSSSDFGDVTVLKSTISSKNLGIVNTSNGLKTPKWFYEIAKNKSSHTIVIENIDLVSEESQEKFYELLKYKEISNVALPKDVKIIVLAKDLKKVSKSILSLCVIAD